MLILISGVPAWAQRTDSLYVWNNPERMKKYPWRAESETFRINAVVWGFDRYIMQEDFAKISWKSVRKNLRHGFVWDNDQFSTNLFAHPYHGNLYYNAARSSGLNFWESASYTFAGSLMWEIAGEIEPPAINDFLATSIGGIALGEVTYRLSSLILDDSRTGANRFLREFAGTLISPVRGLNRIITGDAWKKRSTHYLYHNFEETPVRFQVVLGNRYLADDNYLFRGKHNIYVEFKVDYGDPLEITHNEPYDYFRFKTVFNLIGSQPVISSVNLRAKLLGRNMEPVPGHTMLVGLFQHFDYFDSEVVLKRSGHIPYKISEAAAFGPGMVYEFPSTTNHIDIRQSSFLNLILLGGSYTDYYNVIDRNYNMGSGFSLKSSTSVKFGNYGDFELNLQHYRIFTWKGYENKDLEHTDPLYLNAQGDKGNVMLTVINSVIGIQLNRRFKVNAEASYYMRRTYYKYHDNVSFETFETKLGLAYLF
ncbi:MAG: DUF3943 domain-containing protein [Bacteroides sp.]|nr:DUF3943 domain-containing protein [Bacteroides sp.]